MAVDLSGMVRSRCLILNYQSDCDLGKLKAVKAYIQLVTAGIF
jgi:hypothetical protein